MCRPTAEMRSKLLAHKMSPLLEIFLNVVLLAATPVFFLISLVHDWLIHSIINNTVIYNVSWEDPRMDQREFNLSDDDHVITIASAGDNVLDYIIEGAKVTAVDFNLCQIAFCELKAIACQELEYEEFWAIFAKSDMALLRRRYQETLRQHLSIKSAEWWDTNVHAIDSFMYCGSSGVAAWWLFRVLFPCIGLGWLRQAMLDGMPAAEIRARLGRQEYGLRSLAWILDKLLLQGGCVFAGVPQRQMQLGMHRPNNLAVVMDRIFFNSDLSFDNYFFAGYILGEYLQHNAPRYLRREHYDAMRANLRAGKLHLFHGTLIDAIEQTTDPITVASLLDHMDWMTERQVHQEITVLLRKMNPTTGRIFWRSFADNVHSPALHWLTPRAVPDHDDRVGMYWSTWISHLKDCPYAFEDRIDTWGERQAGSSMLLTGLKVVTFPFWKRLAGAGNNDHAKDMEAFYSIQKEGYDQFREHLLHARSELMLSVPLKKGGNMTWVDVGGGTARNLEYLPVPVLRAYFKEIVIVDVSKSLLEVAQRRIAEMNLQDFVRVVEHDVTLESVFSRLPEEGTVDLVTMSYSLCMIPSKPLALANASRLVKPRGEGIIAVADFHASGLHDDSLPPMAGWARSVEAMFHRKWFAQDGVFLLEDDTFEVARPALEVVWDRRVRGTVPFIPVLQPHHAVVMLQRSS